MAINPAIHNPDGTFKKGNQANPTGRPKRDKMITLLKELFGEDGKELIYLLISQMYGVELDPNKIDKRLIDALPKISKKRGMEHTKVDKALMSSNAKFLWEQLFGKAMVETKTELSTPYDTDIRVEFVKCKKEKLKKKKNKIKKRKRKTKIKKPSNEINNVKD